MMKSPDDEVDDEVTDDEVRIRRCWHDVVTQTNEQSWTSPGTNYGSPPLLFCREGSWERGFQ